MDAAQIRGNGAATEVKFDPVLDISGARDLYARLSQLLSAGAPLSLDGGHITRIDTSALQLLAIFFRSAHESGISAGWSSVSPALRQAAETLGLDEMLKVRA